MRERNGILIDCGARSKRMFYDVQSQTNAHDDFVSRYLRRRLKSAGAMVEIECGTSVSSTRPKDC